MEMIVVQALDAATGFAAGDSMKTGSGVPSRPSSISRR
jgi:hypothetical protein